MGKDTKISIVPPFTEGCFTWELMMRPFKAERKVSQKHFLVIWTLNLKIFTGHGRKTSGNKFLPAYRFMDQIMDL